MRSRGLDPATVEERNLVRIIHDDAPKWAKRWRESYRVMLPLYDHEGEVRSVRVRQVRPEKRGLKSLNAKGFLVKGLTFANPAGVAMLETGELEPGATVYVVEGGPDFLTVATWLSETSADVVLGIGSGQWTAELAARIPDGTQVVVCTDRNDAGFRYAREVARSLEARCKVSVPDPDHRDRRDLNDRWRDDGPSAFDPLEGLIDHQPPPDEPSGGGGSGRRSERPEIIVGIERAEAMFESIRALSAHPEVYVRGSELVTIRKGVIKPLTKKMLYAYLDLSAKFYKWKAGQEGKPELVRMPLPQWLAEMVGEWGEYPDARELDGITTTPVVRPDGSIVTTRGYDPATRLIYDPAGDIPEVVEQPSLADAQAAAAKLLDVVDEVPFERDADRSSWLALVLTLVGRNLVKGNVPLFASVANQARTGKTNLVRYAELIALGSWTGPTRWPTGRDEEELGKRVDAAVLGRRPLMLFDNVRGEIAGTALEAAVTSDTYTPRILGKSEMPTLEQLTVFAISANSASFGGDVAPRTLPMRLFWPGPAPESREFRRADLRAHVQANRDELHVAALTILSAYLSAGAPDMELPAWGSFEAWSKLIRNALVWAGLADPLDSRSGIEKDDATEAAHERVIRFVEDVLPRRDFRTGELAELLEREPGNGWTRQDARELAMELGVWDATSRSVDRRRLGIVIKGRLDRPGRTGLRITRALSADGKPRMHRTRVPYFALASPGEAPTT